MSTDVAASAREALREDGLGYADRRRAKSDDFEGVAQEVVRRSRRRSRIGVAAVVALPTVVLVAGEVSLLLPWLLAERDDALVHT